MILRPLATNEQAGNDGMTHEAIVTADDLTTAAANTAQTIKLCDLVAGDIILRVATRLKTAFKVSSDAAFNTSTYSVGDNAGVATHIAATEVNANGTPVIEKISTATAGTPYTATDKIAVTFNAMAAKSLLSMNTGELHILFKLLRPSIIEQATSAQTITTK